MPTTTVTDELIAQLRALEAQGAEAAGAAGAAEPLEALRTEYLGRKGRLTGILRRLGELSPEERPVVGAEANRVKEALSALLDERAASFAAAADAGPGTDLSLPGRARWKGGVHPVTLVIDEICEIFRDLGFNRIAGPELETQEYNFTRLNFPPNHPATDMHDTFYLTDEVLLRTHTSPVQARVMERFAPPVRVVVPGTVYRRDPFDASHAPAFEQIEGLAVDEGITFADFKATISTFVRRFFGAGAKTRFRPSFFPFTEPSAEVDVSCQLCGGSGCSACKGTGWMEIMGAGMVHPNVFAAAGYDAERYTGYAFGMGPGRIAMQRYGVPDIRLLYESDVRFLGQFT
ncbi:MAG: Phenylalanyl-tRNA synthetase alpha chain [uncultured Gemmatimonadetes bacterium]|uniref:Phenylalanine--tRNA ligase alpha subunit n=1 Tax=uncultured Gemmatimonadota bacterium TaxID=203437 RepID=A0A6J4MPY3_9BACT|nr:MAG: Phenylalanyl-tRNA synthetase alpha chain [uncultured Gemmatimonadota bacterium]